MQKELRTSSQIEEHLCLNFKDEISFFKILQKKNTENLICRSARLNTRILSALFIFRSVRILWILSINEHGSR